MQSGSTGRPKGAQLLNGGLRDLILWLNVDYSIGELSSTIGWKD